MDEVTTKLVWRTGIDKVHIPSEMGSPKEGRMVGTVAEQLSELGGRICYDSLKAKKSRTSAEYHEHILDVGHTAVFRHYHHTFNIHFDSELLPLVILELSNRPGVYFEVKSVNTVKVTMNLQAAVDFARKPSQDNGVGDHIIASKAPQDRAPLSGIRFVYEMLCYHIHNWWRKIAPAIMQNLAWPKRLQSSSNIHLTDVCPGEEMEFASFYIKCSRVCSEELIRHTWQTAPSKRSTRYVDESESPLVRHPVMDTLTGVDHEVHREQIARAHRIAVDCYKSTASVYRKRLVANGANKRAARKQARGAARAVLGLGLATEKIFTASIGQWHHILTMRGHPSADAEIRLLAKQIYQILAPIYPVIERDFVVKKSPDGIGDIVVRRDQNED